MMQNLKVPNLAATSLQNILIFGAGLCILLPATILGYFLIHNTFENIVNSRARLPAKQYADLLSQGIAVTIWNLDREAATEEVNALMANPDIASVTVTDQNHEVFVSTQRNTLLSTRLLQEEREIYFNGELMGHVVIKLSLEHINNEFWQNLYKLGAALAAQVLIALAFIWFLFEKRISGPLSTLGKSIVRISHGDLDLPIQWRYKDEIGNLAIGLDKMRIDLAALIAHREQSRKLLQNSKEEAERANSMKTAFIVNMSHEIRTPMTAILGFTELIKDTSLSDTERQDALSRIEKNGSSLLKLIDNLLDIAKIESGKLSVEKVKFSPRTIVTEVAALLQLEAEKKEIKLNTKFSRSLPDIAFSDPTLLRQILTNLVGNAIKFTQKGQVAVEARGETDNSSNKQYLIFDVRDSGIGIAHENLEKLFKPFGQTDGSTTRKFGGSGLGLILSKRFAQSLGGDVVLTASTPNEGSQFTLRIEAGPFEDSALLGESEPSPQNKKMHSNRHRPGKSRCNKWMTALLLASWPFSSIPPELLPSFFRKPSKRPIHDP